MGAGNSLPLPRYGCCIRPQNPNRCRENHSRLPKARGGHRRNLSAAFSIQETENWCANDLVNINVATEEELMTLPGINRQTAQNIVEYRRQIDGFRKVEDLALVSGVGANQLSHIRMELSVGGKRGGGLSKNSSASSSGIDLSMHDNVSRASVCGTARPKVNLNSSNVFQLMKVRPISQGLAENIVAYRDRKGPFASFDELLKVKGVKTELLSAVQPYLVLREGDVSAADPPLHDGCKRLVDANALCGPSDELTSSYGPMSKKSIRKSRGIVATSRDVLRLASWNLDRCGVEKILNPGVREVVAMTLLENGFGIVAVQDLTDPSSLEKLLDEFSRPSLPNVKSWTGSTGNWKHIVSPEFNSTNEGVHHLGFLYDVEKGVELRSTTSTRLDSDDAGPPLSVFVAEFKVQSFELTVVNFQMTVEVDDPTSKSVVERVASLLAQYEEENKNVALAGYFGMSPDSTAMTPVREIHFNPVLSSDKFTDISTANADGSKCMENIWISSKISKVQTGNSDVIRGDLTNPWIPDGPWGWGGTASRQCPIVTEIVMKISSRDQSSRLRGPTTDDRTASFVVGSN